VVPDKGASPFTPGSPVPIELFVGRAPQIMQMMRSVDQSIKCRQENIFVIGERGAGKTSIASFVKYVAEREKEILGIHVFLGGVASLPELVRKIYEELLRALHDEQWFSKLRGFFGDFIKEIDLFGVKVGFMPREDDLDQLVRSFPQSLAALTAELKDEKKGVLIILDDLDSLSTQVEFANWYKSLVDEIATQFQGLPVTVMLIGLSGIIDRLSSLQPSLARIFRIVEVEKLSNEEVSEFFQRAFGEGGIKVDSDALELMVRFSSGIPVIMQEIGDAAFWADQDGRIGDEDASVGVITAAQNIGRRYLDPQLYRAVRSKSYRSILRKLGLQGAPLNRRFTRKEVTEYLSEPEKRVFDNFLQRLKQIGVIEPDREMGRGCYRFANEMYPVYVYMEAKAFADGVEG
jgi:type II secretory pathway predicted ATPase ExeA